MTNATHTPGPWLTLNRGYKSCVTDNDMNWNAEIVGPGHAVNACLIAAAPDLLAALEGMVEMATHHMMEPKERREILRNARAAIAKAKGEQ
jgi:hypothetical protein